MYTSVKYKLAFIATAIIFLFVILHIKKYRQYNTGYQIDQQELDYVSGKNLYNQLDPLVITFIEDIPLEDNINQYSLISPLSIQKQAISLSQEIINKTYYYNPNELLFIRPKTKCNIVLVNPDYLSYFKNSSLSTPKFIRQKELLEKDYKKVHIIEVIVREYNIIYIPRRWIFKIETEDPNVDFYYTNSLLTRLIG